MTNSHTVDVELFRAARLTNSTNGNPRYDLHTSEGTYRTQADASCSYDMDNVIRKIPDGGSIHVRLSMTPKRHHVWGIELL